jgi:hypothetical protein
LERLHNARALSGVVSGGLFLKKPTSGYGFGSRQLWNRSSRSIGLSANRAMHMN